MNMEAGTLSYQPLNLRRASCSDAETRRLSLSIRHQENVTVTVAETTRSSYATVPSFVNKILDPNSSVSTSLSSNEGTVTHQMTRLSSMDVLTSADVTLPLNYAKYVTLTRKLSNCDKNEAEIIDDLPVNQRRASLPTLLGSERLVGGFTASSAAFIKSNFEGQIKRTGYITTSVDRELQMLYKNSLENRRLEQKFKELDKQSFAANLELRQKMNKVFTDYKKLIQRSPTAGEWLSMKKYRTRTTQEREQEIKSGAYNKRQRHARPLTVFQGEQSIIKTCPALGKSLVLEPDTGNITRDGNGTRTPNLTRRHTISGDTLICNLSEFNQSHSTAQPYQTRGRRTTLSDINVDPDARSSNSITLRKNSFS